MKGDILYSIKPWEQSDYNPGDRGYDGLCSGEGNFVSCPEPAVFTGEFNTGKWAQCLKHAKDALTEHRSRTRLAELHAIVARLNNEETHADHGVV